MYSVAQVLNPKFVLSWYEAVALVQEMASMLGPAMTVPAFEDLFLDDSGSLTFGFASEVGEDPVAGLTDLLHRLLEGVDAPEGLRALAEGNPQGASKATTVEGFSRALAFYERPGRTGDIAAIARRLGEFSSQGNPDAEFEKLRDKVAGRSEEKEAKPKRPAKRRLTRRQQAVAAAVLCVVTLGVLVARSVGSTAAAAPALVSRATGKVTGVVSAGLDRIGLAKSSGTEVKKPADVTPVEEPKSSTTAQRNQTLARKLTPSTGGSRKEKVAAPVTSLIGSSKNATEAAPTVAARAAVAKVALPEPEPAATVPDLPRISMGDMVYSKSDAIVAPPKLLRPQFSKEPEPGPDTGYFDVLVNESGTVDEVKLISPRHRYHDRMLVAAAKAWKFRPATFNGRPVKYRVRIAIILKELA
jgi:hypothetical protein